MKVSKHYKVIIEIDADGYYIRRVPALPGCYTQAKDLNELKKEFMKRFYYVLMLLNLIRIIKKK